ncbi:MAG: hypothetical protein NVSMB27_03190 [Ktedonobacteraceae bacterium]
MTYSFISLIVSNVLQRDVRPFATRGYHLVASEDEGGASLADTNRRMNLPIGEATEQA